MAETTTEVRADIEQTRARMSGAITELERKVDVEPVREPLRPVARPPHALALRVVEPTLDHRRAGRRRGRLRAPDVVRVHVRDEDPHHGPFDPRVHRLPGHHNFSPDRNPDKG